MATDLPGFKIIEKIGTGGMATVWRACQLSLDRIVAIKILNPSFTAQPDDVQRFQREAQSAAKLKHSGIVQVYDANAVDGLYYFVMEYVSGYTVGEWINRKGVLRESNALLVAECVAEALKYAWDAEQIVHCDIKPDNILVDSDGTVKVSDLGLARTLSAMSRLEEESDEVMGTPYYISPEQAQGRADLDFRADIYSLGSMMFHMLTGKMPFQDENAENVMELQVTTDLPAVRDINPDVSRGAAALVKRMVSKLPEDRPNDWQAVLEEIARVKHGTPPVSAAASGRSDTMRLKKRHDQIERIQGKSQHSFVKTLLGLLALTAVIVIFVLFANSKATHSSTLPPANPVRVAPTPVAADPMAQWREQLADAREWARAHPNVFDDAIARFEAVASAAPDTDVALAATSEIKLLQRARSDARRRALSVLVDEVRALAEKGDYIGAAQALENYSGAFAQDTVAERRERAKLYREKAEASVVETVPPENTTPAAPVDVDVLLDKVALHILAGHHDVALRSMTTVLWSMEESPERASLQGVYDVLRNGLAADQQIIDSFSRQTAQVISVNLANGPRKLFIHSVSPEGVRVADPSQATHADPDITLIGLDDLSYREKLTRIQSDDAQATALARGLMALEAKSTTYAMRYFADTHEALASRLIGGLRR